MTGGAALPFTPPHPPLTHEFQAGCVSGSMFRSRGSRSRGSRSRGSRSRGSRWYGSPNRFNIRSLRYPRKLRQFIDHLQDLGALGIPHRQPHRKVQALAALPDKDQCCRSVSAREKGFCVVDTGEGDAVEQAGVGDDPPQPLPLNIVKLAGLARKDSGRRARSDRCPQHAICPNDVSTRPLGTGSSRNLCRLGRGAEDRDTERKISGCLIGQDYRLGLRSHHRPRRTPGQDACRCNHHTQDNATRNNSRPIGLLRTGHGLLSIQGLLSPASVSREPDPVGPVSVGRGSNTVYHSCIERSIPPPYPLLP